nr:flagellar basal-body rod protein FlgB [uncultured bacterium]
MPTPLIDPIFDGLARALDVHNRRHDVLATNLANVETPGFRAQEVDFRSALARAFERTEEAARPADLIEDTSAPARADGTRSTSTCRWRSSRRTRAATPR